MNDLIERLATILESMDKSLKTIARAVSNRPQSSSPTAKSAAGSPRGAQEQYKVAITGFGVRWRSETGAFWRCTILVDEIEYPCSIGVKDELGFKLAEGDKILVSGVPERKTYKGEESISLFANAIEYLEAKSEPGADDSDITIGGNEDIPF